MTASIGEQIMEAVATKFGGVTNGSGAVGAGPGGSTVFRSRLAALALGEGIAIVIKPKEEEIERISRVHTKRSFVIETEILARGDPADSIADPVRVAMHAALLADQTLGGLSQAIVEESTEWTYEEADQTAVSVLSRYKIIFLTPANTLTAAA